GKPRGVPNYMLGTERAKKGPRSDFKDRKTPVVAGVERGGRVKAAVVHDVKPITLAAHVRNMVDTSATLNTDERISYQGVGREFAAHHTVNHHKAEWANGNKYTNTIEGFFAGLKRQIHGIHHSVSKKHLHRYVSEVEFKYNTRDLSNGERTALAIRSADNRRLTYKQQTGKK
ncbi:MAG: IS1595 family transposase, partial [Gemmatimonadaceae bacterium]